MIKGNYPWRDTPVQPIQIDRIDADRMQGNVYDIFPQTLQGFVMAFGLMKMSKEDAIGRMKQIQKLPVWKVTPASIKKDLADLGFIPK